MTTHRRIVLLYRPAKCGAHAGRLRAALDERYREPQVMDLGLDGDAAALDDVAQHLRSEDLILVLVDPEWVISAEAALAPATVLEIAVEIAVGEASGDAGLVISEATWEADVQHVLTEVEACLAGPAAVPSDDGLDPEDPDELFQEGAALQRKGEHQDAIDLFEAIVETGSSLAGPAAYAAGRSYEKLKDSNHAVQSYREAISLGPRDAAAAAAYGLGRLLQHRREFEQAADAYSDAIELGDAAMRTRAEELRSEALRKAAQR
jgi:tetratricopeptide (TPR) repeat protein